MNIVDLFAGPGGWDFAAASLDLDPFGIEWDAAACETRAAAGLRTRQADVAALDPTEFGPCDLLIASPPCQAFSRAGKREGIDDLPHVYEAALALAEGRDPGEVEWKDPRAALVIEPLRWALALEPTYLAWEQVPDVIPFWRYCSGILEAAGWHTWTGVLEAERYGVPQTRERAILLASRVGHVEPPRPTHQRYVKGEPAQLSETLEGTILPWVSMAEALGWSDVTEVRNYHVLDPAAPRPPGGGNPSPTFDPEARPARTLTHRVGGWALTTRDATDPADSSPPWHPEDEVGFPRRDDSPEAEEGEYRDRDRRPATEPAVKLGEKARSWDRVQFRGGAQEKATVRSADEPAPTIKGGHDAAEREWTQDRPAPTLTTTRRSDKGMLVGRQLPEGEGRNVGGRNYDRRQKQGPKDRRVDVPVVPDTEPAPTLTAAGLSTGRDVWRDREERAACGCWIGVVDAGGFCACCHAHIDDPAGLYAVQGDGTHSFKDCPENWPAGRPATVVTGDARVTAPGRLDRDPNYKPGDTPPSNKEGAVRVSLAEAAVLQSFPPDYPFQGTKSKQFEQVGNAVPPLLARAILEQLVGAVLPVEARQAA